MAHPKTSKRRSPLSLTIPDRFQSDFTSIEGITGSRPSIHKHPQKSVMLPSSDKHPSFEEVASIALTGALFGQTVSVICLSHGMLVRWMQRLAKTGIAIASLELFDITCTTLAEWKILLGSQPYDITVFHGVEPELRARRLTVGHLRALVEAVPSGLVLVA